MQRAKSEGDQERWDRLSRQSVALETERRQIRKEYAGRVECIRAAIITHLSRAEHFDGVNIRAPETLGWNAPGRCVRTV